MTINPQEIQLRAELGALLLGTFFNESPVPATVPPIQKEFLEGKAERTFSKIIKTGYRDELEHAYFIPSLNTTVTTYSLEPAKIIDSVSITTTTGTTTSTTGTTTSTTSSTSQLQASQEKS